MKKFFSLVYRKFFNSLFDLNPVVAFVVVVGTLCICPVAIPIIAVFFILGYLINI